MHERLAGDCSAGASPRTRRPWPSNPTDPKNVLVGQNDYRNGATARAASTTASTAVGIGDGLMPESFTAPGFTAPRHYWDASGDPVVAFDSDGYAYYACLQFNRGVTSDLGGRR